MEVCGEHDREIVWSAKNYRDKCPACEQIEELRKEYDELLAEKDIEINDLTNEVDELRSQVSVLEDDISGYSQ